MSDKSKIEWTDATWTPIRARNLKTGKVGWHCEHATTGCEFCYSEGFNMRLGTGLPFKPGHRKDIEIFLDDDMLLAPLRWKKPRMIFVCSMTDAFADFVSDEWLDKMFAVMALCPQHTFQVLTKRADRMRAYLSAPTRRNSIELAAERWPSSGKPWSPKHCFRWPLPNVWIGTSVERQKEAVERIPDVMATPAAVRFVSVEPLLSSVDLRQWMHDWGCGCGYGGDQTLDHCPNCGWVGEGPTIECIGGGDAPGDCPDCNEPLSDYYACPECKGAGQDGSGFGPNTATLDWIIVGGESGKHARPMHPDWARSLRDQCAAADVPFFFKQRGEFAPLDTFSQAEDDGQVYRCGKKAAGRHLDGKTHDAFPLPSGLPATQNTAENTSA